MPQEPRTEMTAVGGCGDDKVRIIAPERPPEVIDRLDIPDVPPPTV